jgi:integrase
MTFEQQAEQFIKAIQNRKRRPATEATVRTYESSLKRILPVLGHLEVSQVNNAGLKILVKNLLDAELAPGTIGRIIAVVRLVVASAVDENGEKLYSRSWNYEFADVPVVVARERKAPMIGGIAVSRSISKAFGAWKGLYALLAGSGLRIGEALALYAGPEDPIQSTWDPETATIYVKSTVVNGHIQPSPKSEAGIRQVDLTPELNDFLKATLSPVTGELLFTNDRGGIVNNVTLYKHSKQDGVPGYHSFRRFRVTHLRQGTTPEGLIKYWVGHEDGSITDRYDRIRENLAARKRFVQQAGLGFELTEASV